MPKVKRTSYADGASCGLVFHCPGCDMPHAIVLKGRSRETPPKEWEWNGDLELPTITPSVAVSEVGPEESTKILQCHSNITQGKIYFHSDSRHKLACLTVDLPEWDSAQ